MALRLKRRNFPKSLQKHHAKKLLYQCQKNALFRNIHSVALYATNDGEIDSKYLIDFLIRQGKKIYLPVLFKKKMHFSPLHKTTLKNRFGIKEPIFKNRVHAKKINLVLMPAVAFDKKGNRLGMGGGFYDRALYFTKNQIFFYLPKIYVLAHHFQKINHIHAKAWDIKPLGIISENYLLKSGKMKR